MTYIILHNDSKFATIVGQAQYERMSGMHGRFQNWELLAEFDSRVSARIYWKAYNEAVRRFG